MYDESKIEESLEFCHDIEKYYKDIKIENKKIGEKSVPFEPMEQASFVGKECKRPIILIILKEIFVLILCMVLAYGIASLVNEYCFHQTRVEGISMEDTLDDNDFLLINKFIYHFQKPKRFDIVIFPYEYNVFYIKRIIGLPGETVQIKNGFVYIDGNKLKENYGKETMNEGGIASEPIRLGQNEYFVLGDNRNHSIDSREPTVGVITEEKIIGKACLRIFPFSKVRFF